MKTDPRKGCANERELWLWAAIHDLLAHPLMVLTWYSRPALWFHDFTSHRAWPRAVSAAATVTAHATRFGSVRVAAQSPGVWRVYHGQVNHAITLAALSGDEALYRALRWFDSLGAEFGGRFSPQTSEAL
ncbi:hypothetical protein [Comamonas koreensis]|uniref:hypothetical protein n=1 Tax=Comamonas koreensis TaxID=160825 RepID=UPI0015FAE136|nr:hypothetical protein [Comamonas koreensis]